MDFLDNVNVPAQDGTLSPAATMKDLDLSVARIAATLAAVNWSGSAAPWTQTLAIVNDDRGCVGLAAGVTMAQFQAAAGAGDRHDRHRFSWFPIGGLDGGARGEENSRKGR